MLRLDDPRWSTLRGGYRAPYDASLPLAALERGEDGWNDLWDGLHHQGDVGEASYAAVPHLVRIASGWPTRDWNVYSLVSLIEVERHRRGNPPIPAWLSGHTPALGASCSRLRSATCSLPRTARRCGASSVRSRSPGAS